MRHIAMILGAILMLTTMAAAEPAYAPFGLQLRQSVYGLPGGAAAYDGLKKLGYVLTTEGTKLDGKPVASKSEYDAWRIVFIEEQAQDELAATRPDLGLKMVPKKDRRTSGTYGLPTLTYKHESKNRKITLQYDHSTGAIVHIYASFAYTLPGDRPEFLAAFSKMGHVIAGLRRDSSIAVFPAFDSDEPQMMSLRNFETGLDLINAGSSDLPQFYHMEYSPGRGDAGGPQIYLSYAVTRKQEVIWGNLEASDRGEPPKVDNIKADVDKRVSAAPKPVVPEPKNTGGL